MHKKLSKIDRLIILWNTGWKFARGLVRRPFLKKASGLFLVGRSVSITHGKHIVCGRNVKFEDYSEIHGLCRDGLIFGDNVTIGPHAYIGCSGKITIGKNVMFGPKCSLFAENHNFLDKSTSIKSQGVNQKGITVEDNCWIGSNVIILDGVTIGAGSVIAAGTLISKDVPPGSIVMDKRNKFIKVR